MSDTSLRTWTTFSSSILHSRDTWAVSSSWLLLIFAMVCLPEFLPTTTVPVPSAQDCTGQSLAAALWRNTVSSHLRADTAFSFICSWPSQLILLSWESCNFLPTMNPVLAPAMFWNLIPVASHWPCLLSRIWICCHEILACAPFLSCSSQSCSQRFRGSSCRILTGIRVFSKILLPAFPPSPMETVTESVLTYAHAICEVKQQMWKASGDHEGCVMAPELGQFIHEKLHQGKVLGFCLTMGMSLLLSTNGSSVVLAIFHMISAGKMETSGWYSTLWKYHLYLEAFVNNATVKNCNALLRKQLFLLAPCFNQIHQPV